MANTWFIYSNDVVTGPFTTEDIQSRIATGRISARSFIWWRGQREWVPIESWSERLPAILQAQANAEKAIWYIDMGAAPIGPLTQKELVQNLRILSDLTRVKLWSVGMSAWVSLFEVGEIMDDLGISRREAERAPVMGSVAINRSNEAPRGFVLKADSISVGGIGLSGSHDLRRGDDVALLLKCPDLPSQLHLRGEVVYVTSGGAVGVRFIKITAETQSIIHDYVKRFQSATQEPDESAA